MPSYVVEHSYPLSPAQKTQIAEAITHLHSSKFLAPSIFVHVKFVAHDASDGSYFIAGKPRTNCTNRIIGNVRTSPSRTKKHWDELGREIEEAWYTTVSGEVIDEGENRGKRKDAIDDPDKITDAKKLRAVFFNSLVSVWENGDAVPLAGEEAAWLKEHREEFQAKADAGDELYEEMMDEITTREDLKKAYGV